MKIAGYQLDNLLSRQLKPVYLLSGDEAFLRYEASLSIREAAKRDGFLEIAKWSSQQEQADDALATLLIAANLFQQKQLIELDFADKFPTATQQTILEAALTSADPEKLLVIQCKKLDEKVQKTAWFKALDAIGCIVTIWPLQYDQLKMFIVARAKKYQLTIDTNAVAMLADLAEGNVNMAAQTLEKAQILGESRITTSLIQSLAIPDNHYSIFDLSDALVTKNTSRMLTILTNLQNINTEPTLILWSLTREVRLLIDCLVQQQARGDLQTVFKKHRVLSKKQELIQRHLKHFSLAHCYQHLERAFLIDQKMKHFLIADTWRALHIFCLSISN